jgi:hypothetical protein
MKYDRDGELHVLSLDKDEFIMLIALVHEGLERISEKRALGDQLATMKHEGAELLVQEINEKVMMGS